MTWTYNAIGAASGNRDKVRFLIGDTDVVDQLLQDEEIELALTLGGGVQSAAAISCDSLAARFSRECDMTVGPLSRSAGQRATAYAERAKMLRVQQVALGGAEIFIGGISVSDKETLSADTNAVQPEFGIGQDDYPGVNTATLRFTTGAV